MGWVRVEIEDGGPGQLKAQAARRDVPLGARVVPTGHGVGGTLWALPRSSVGG